MSAREDIPTPAMAYPMPRGPHALGGAYEGASRASRELAAWAPAIRSADGDLNHDKPGLDVRVRDLVRNDGFAAGGVAIHKDSIVGGMYRLNAAPNWQVLGATEAWAEEFQQWAEQNFTLWAESFECWPDAQRVNTLTGLVRLVVGMSVIAGEVLSTCEWMRPRYGERRPCRTAVHMIDLDRLSNPHEQADDDRLRRGVERDLFGAPVAYHIRSAHPGDWYTSATGNAFRWDRVPARKPWGRPMVIHLFEQLRPDQSRGVSEIVSVLKEMKMTRNFRDIVLQNAVVNATYAAAIESELPTETLWDQLGQGTGDNGVQRYLEQLAAYTGGAQNLHIDGVKIPHLFPGTKLALKPMGTPGGVGTDFEQALIRYVAAAFGLSYEELSRDYTKTNYSSARAAMLNTFKGMQARKKLYADRFASTLYALWLEEQINAGNAPLPPGHGPSDFYVGLNKEAYTACSWLGASRGQIDELKETQAAQMRIDGGLSTYEDEIARTGKDYREVFAQQAREKALRKKLGIEIEPAMQQGALGLGGKDKQQQSSKDDE